MRPGPRVVIAGLALAMLGGAWLVPGSSTAAGPRSVIPDGMPYDSTRGDSVGESALCLSWGAPCGMRGARSNVDLADGDTTRVDTLYLSLETGRDLPHLFAIFARLYIHPAAGDSLGLFWQVGGQGANMGGLPVQMDADGTFPCGQPWIYPGMGAAHYEFSPAVGELLLIYAVKPEDAAPISGRARYCFARLMLRHRRVALEGARRPVCIEWVEAAYSGGGHDIYVRRGPARFATVNAPDDGICAGYRRALPVRAWHPPGWFGPGSVAPGDSTRR